MFQRDSSLARRCSRKCKLPLVRLLALGLAFAASAFAQQSEPLPEVFSDQVDVRVVNVEVVVTDKDGNRRKGLEPSDFRLLVDGLETAIDYFSEVQDGRVVDQHAGSVSSVPTLERGRDVGTNYLVFIDDWFSIGRDRDRVLSNLEQQLAGIRPRDRVAMVAFDGRKLDMLTTWTNSPREIRRALQRAQSRDANGLAHMSAVRTNDAERRERRYMRQLQVERAGLETDPRDMMRTTLEGPERDFANRLTNEVKRSVAAATSTLRSFAQPEGRKVMLVLSGGWPFAPTEYVVNDWNATAEDLFSSGAFDESGSSGSNLFEPLVTTANLLGYTLYPVDVQGLRREDASDASVGVFEQTLGEPTEGEVSPARTLPRELYNHASLDFLAERTGGEALINAKRDHALEQVIRDTATYYWLGFQPQRNEDDAAHTIEVQLRDRPGLRVRARAGFVDLSRSTEVTMLVESSLLVGDPPSANPLGLAFGKPKKRRGRTTMPLEVRIPLDEIVLLPTAGRFRNDLEVRITVMDERGNRSPVSIDTVSINGAAAPRPGQYYTYITDLTLKSRQHRIVVAVFDPISGAILSSSGEIGFR